MPLLDFFGRGGSLKSQLVRRLPAVARLPDAGRPATCRAGCRWTSSSPRRSALDDVEEAFDKMHARRGPALGGDCCDGAGSTTSSPPARSASTAAPGTSTTTSGSSATTRECVVIDAPHDADAIAAGGRRPARCVAIVCTHAHDDHVDAAPELGRRDRRADPAAPGRPAAVGPDPSGPRPRTRDSPTGRRSSVGGHRADGAAHAGPRAGRGVPRADARRGVQRRHAVPRRPGHRPLVLDFPTIIESIRDRLLTLPPETVVHTGHGDDTTIGAEAPHLDEWIARGH